MKSRDPHPLPDNPLSEKWLTQEETMNILQIGKTTLKTYRRLKLLLASKIRGRIFILRQSVFDMLDSHCIL